MSKYIVTHDEIEGLEGVERPHFLNEAALRRVKRLSDLTGLQGMGFHIVEVMAGRQSTELHSHYFEDECVYVLEGEALATIGNATHTVGAGDFIGYRAGGEAHKLENTGQSVLNYIVVGQRLDHDIVDYPVVRKRLFINGAKPACLVDTDDLEEQS